MPPINHRDGKAVSFGLYPDYGAKPVQETKSEGHVGGAGVALKENKARKLLDEIMRYKTTITLALTTESM
jgi:hypothetical protein